MKLLIFFIVLVIITLSVLMLGSRHISDADLTVYLTEYPKLYNYGNWSITNRVENEFQDYTEIEFSYRYTRTAKTHVAVIKGVYIAVDNAFVNNCVDHPYTLESREDDCAFITEIGTVESVESDHTSVIVDKWGILSRNNLEQSLRSKETFYFLSGVLNLFKH